MPSRAAGVLLISAMLGMREYTTSLPQFKVVYPGDFFLEVDDSIATWQGMGNPAAEEPLSIAMRLPFSESAATRAQLQAKNH